MPDTLKSGKNMFPMAQKSKPFARRSVQNFILKSNIFLGKLVTFLLIVLILLPRY